MVKLAAFNATQTTWAPVRALRCGLILALMLLATTACLLAQRSVRDSLLTASTTLPMLYMHGMGAGASIYNGPEYTGSYPGTKGTPFFPIDQFTPGMLTFKGISYYGINLAYDVVTDQVVIKGPQNLGLILLPDNVDSFMINGHLFIRYMQEQKVQNAPVTGFYELLHPAPLLVLAKRTKVSHRGLSAEDPMVFTQFNSYFVKKENGFHVIAGRRALLTVFHGRRKELRNFWKSHAVNFKKDIEKAIVETIQYISQPTR